MARFSIDEQIANCDKKIAELQEKKTALIEKKKAEEEQLKNQEKQKSIDIIVKMLKENNISLEDIQEILIKTNQADKVNTSEVIKDQPKEQTIEE